MKYTVGIHIDISVINFWKSIICICISLNNINKHIWVCFYYGWAIFDIWFNNGTHQNTSRHGARRETCEWPSASADSWCVIKKFKQNFLLYRNVVAFRDTASLLLRSNAALPVTWAIFNPITIYQNTLFAITRTLQSTVFIQPILNPKS